MVKKKTFNMNIQGDGKLSIIPKNSDVYMLKINNKSIEITSGDILKILNRGLNNSVNIRNNRFSVAIVDTSTIAKNSFINSNSNLINRYFTIHDNVSGKSIKVEMNNNQFLKFMEALNDYKLNDVNIPFKPGQKIWVGDIGFEKNSDQWVYFKEPYQVEVDSVEKSGNFFIVKLNDDKSNKIGDMPLSQTVLTFEGNKQRSRNFLVCGETKEQVIEEMFNRLNEKGKIPVLKSSNDIGSIFEPFEHNERSSFERTL